MLLPLTNRCFRSHPTVALIRMERLPKKQRATLGAEFYGILRSRQFAQPLMAIDIHTAALFLGLRTPHELSAETRTSLGTGADRILARLVCDGFLQIQARDGSFVQRHAAYSELFSNGGEDDVPVTAHPIRQMSRTALQLGARLHTLDSQALARRLYQYNSAPQTSAWTNELDSRTAVRRWLGVTPDAPSAAALRREYVGWSQDAKNDPWIRWRHRGMVGNTPLCHKIYVSPAPAHLPEVLRCVVDTCCRMHVPAFKVGGTTTGVLRPDKCVLYFNEAGDLWSVARELSTRLLGCQPQGVPFSAPIEESGLLSWAVDPGTRLGNAGVHEVSWRTFVARHLGEALHSRAANNSDDLIAFALQRIRLEGVNPDCWSNENGN